MARIRFWFRTVFAGLLVGLGSFLLWVINTWRGISAEEIVFHLKVSLDGTGRDIIIGGLSSFFIPAVIALVILWLFRKNRAASVISVAVMVSFFVGSCFFFGYYYHIVKYLMNQGKNSTFIEDHYVDPQNVEITFPEKKRNLIYIFLESVEGTYSDQELGGGV